MVLLLELLHIGFELEPPLILDLSAALLPLVLYGRHVSLHRLHKRLAGSKSILQLLYFSVLLV